MTEVMTVNEKLIALAEKMKHSDPTKVKAMVGFDGYVDTVTHPVDKRTGPDSYIRIKTLADYGQKFIDAAGLSMNIEMVPVNAKIGGIGAILANSLSSLGFQMTYIGAMGKEALNPVYHDFQKRATLYSISDPGLSDAIEFMDGKVISSKLEPLKDVNWDSLMKVLTVQQLSDIFDSCDFVAYGGWTLTINVMSIWEGVIREVFPLMKRQDKAQMFFDLSDPAKRTPEDIMDAIECIRRYQEKFRVGMGFNEKESYEIVELFGGKKEDFDSIVKVAEFLKEQLGISYVVIHPVKCACGVTESEKALVEGPYCENPKLTTGAGDNFNAGFTLGMMMGFDLEEALTMGTANSGFYVRNARSANYQELCNFVEKWGNGDI